MLTEQGFSKLNALKEFSIATMRVIHYTRVHLIMSLSFRDDEVSKDLPLSSWQLHVSQ